MLDINTALLIVFLVSFVFTLILCRLYIKKVHKKNRALSKGEGKDVLFASVVVKDMYKKGDKMVPTAGGLAILAGSMFSIIAAQLLGFNLIPLLIFYFVVIMYAFYGFADDFLGFKRKYIKTFVLFILALPLALLVTDTAVNFFGLSLELGWVFAFILAPLYVMVVANLMGMHAGFNGLMPGLGFILLFFVGLKSYLISGLTYIPLLLPVLGALLAFLYFSSYPARLFGGNITPFLVGGALGGFIIIANLEWFGIFILIPHIVNMLLWFYWTRHFDRWPHVKYGKLREDGTIEVPNYLTVKYIVCKFFRVTELKATYICYLITVLFCVVGLVIF